MGAGTDNVAPVTMPTPITVAPVIAADNAPTYSKCVRLRIRASSKVQDLLRYSYNWMFNDPWFLGASASFERDPIRELDALARRHGIACAVNSLA